MTICIIFFVAWFKTILPSSRDSDRWLVPIAICSAPSALLKNHMVWLIPFRVDDPEFLTNLNQLIVFKFMTVNLKLLKIVIIRAEMASLCWMTTSASFDPFTSAPKKWYLCSFTKKWIGSYWIIVFAPPLITIYS